MSTPHISTIAPGQPYARILAERLLARYGSGAALSRVVLLLPNRRACLWMRESFLAANDGKPLLLPRIQPLADVDADLWMTEALYASEEALAETIPPAMPTLRRLLMLARLVYAFEHANKKDKPAIVTMEHAVLLADALAALLDECTQHRVPPERLRALVQERELAKHWEVSVEFLEVILTQWPQLEQAEGMISAAARQDRMLTLLAQYWQAHPPAHPVVAAGTTGSIPATAELLKVIAHLPQGEVVLPGLDGAMDNTVWKSLAPTHPQYLLRELLHVMGVERTQVQVVEEGLHNLRQHFLRMVMLPPEYSDQWATLSAADIENGFSGMLCVECDTQEQEAAAITLKLREALTFEGKRAMLVTPDRGLATRVSRMLEYYGIQVDDSSGKRISELPEAVFLMLVLEAAQSDGAPLELLALLRHPLCRMGEGDVVRIRADSREIERVLLRGVRPAGGLNGLVALAEDSALLSSSAKRTLKNLSEMLSPLVSRLRPLPYQEQPLAALLGVHLEVAECLSSPVLWTGHAGEKLASTLADIAGHAEVSGTIDPASYAGILTSLLVKQMYQPPYGGHPRLSILSPMEARMQEADVVILGGLNEEVWPAPPLPDPWMNQTMRKDMGLPAAERSIGQSAHDVMLLCMAEEVMLTRSKKRGSAPSIPSRWWLRLQAVIGQEAMLATGRQWAMWGAQLFAAEQDAQKMLAVPLATPPLAARPTELSATRIETLMRDPYQIYASRILCLKPLSPIDDELQIREFGTAVHKALELYINRHPEVTPPNALELLLAAGKQVLQEHFHHPQVEAFWWPRFMRVAQWYSEEEQRRRTAGMQRQIAEHEVERRLHAAGQSYSVRARIDRVEYYADGVRLIDYKTTTLPTVADVHQGVACQMLVEAWIMAQNEAALALHEPEYWKLSGTSIEATIRPIFGKTKREDYIHHTGKQLEKLLGFFAKSDTPYRICPDPELAPDYNDYEHLERRAEWMM